MSLESIFRLSVIVNVIDNMSNPMGRMNATFDESIGKVEGLNRSFGNLTKAGAVIGGAGAVFTDALMKPVKATFETKKALGELSTVGIKDLQMMEQAAKSFSNTWAGTTKADFITAAYDIKSGISSLSDESVAGYTNIAGITAKGTKSSIAEMTSLFATGYGIYKKYYGDLTDLQFGEMFSAGIAKAVQDYKTTGSAMAQSIESLGDAATSSKVPLEEQLAILGTLQATMSGSEAGTKYKAFLRTVAKAGEDLELKFVDANNQLLSTPEILGALKSKFGETIDEAEKLDIQKAFGSDEAMAFVTGLYTKTSDLQSGMMGLYNEMGTGIETARVMADAINSADGEKYTTVTQQLHNLNETIGNQLAPTFNDLRSKVSETIQKTDDWVGKNQELVRNIMIAAVVFGLFLTTIGTLGATIGVLGYSFTKIIMVGKGLGTVLGLMKGGFETLRLYAMYGGDGLKFLGGKLLAGAGAAKTFVTGLFNMAKQAIVTAVQALPGLIASVWSFTAALLANPITWVVVGIIALIAAIILLWQNWDAVTAFLSATWTKFVDGVKAGIAWIMNLFAGMPLGLQIAIAAFFPFLGIPLLIATNWGTIVDFFKNLWIQIPIVFKNGVQGIKDFISGTFGWFKESGSKIMSTFTEGIKSAVSGPIDAVKGGLSKIRSMLPFSDAKEGPLSTLTLSGKRVFETITTGMIKTQHLPAQITEQAFDEMDLSNKQNEGQLTTSISNREIKKVSLKEVRTSDQNSSKETVKETDKNTIIQKFIMQVDISKLKDLQTLFTLVDELKERAYGFDEDDTELVII